MNRKLPIAILLGFALSAWTGYAQEAQQKNHPPGGPGGAPPPHRPPMILVLLDTDKNGTLSAEEIKNAEAALNKLDKNGDGELSKDEMCPPPRGPKGKKGKPKKKPADQ